MDYLNRELAISLVKATTTPNEIRSIVRNNNAKSVQMSENMRLIIENIYQTKRVEVRVGNGDELPEVPCPKEVAVDP